MPTMNKNTILIKSVSDSLVAICKGIQHDVTGPIISTYKTFSYAQLHNLQDLPGRINTYKDNINFDKYLNLLNAMQSSFKVQISSIQNEQIKNEKTLTLVKSELALVNQKLIQNDSESSIPDHVFDLKEKSALLEEQKSLQSKVEETAKAIKSCVEVTDKYQGYNKQAEANIAKTNIITTKISNLLTDIPKSRDFISNHINEFSKNLNDIFSKFPLPSVSAEIIKLFDEINYEYEAQFNTIINETKELSLDISTLLFEASTYTFA